MGHVWTCLDREVKSKTKTNRIRLGKFSHSYVRGRLVRFVCCWHSTLMLMWPLLCVVDKTCSSSIKTLIINKKLNLSRGPDDVCCRWRCTLSTSSLCVVVDVVPHRWNLRVLSLSSYIVVIISVCCRWHSTFVVDVALHWCWCGCCCASLSIPVVVVLKH